MSDKMYSHNDKIEIRQALIDQKYYRPHDVFQNDPEYYPCGDDRYLYKVELYRWNTKSTRMIILYVRFDQTKQRYIFSRKMGVKRISHGEKMR